MWGLSTGPWNGGQVDLIPNFMAEDKKALEALEPLLLCVTADGEELAGQASNSENGRVKVATPSGVRAGRVVTRPEKAAS